MEVFAEKGCIVANNVTATRTRLTTVDGIMSEKPLYSFVERYANAYRLQLAAFFESITSDTDTIVDATDAQHAVAIAVAANESLKTNRPITLQTGKNDD